MMMSVMLVFGQKKSSKSTKDSHVSKVITSNIQWWGYKVVKSEATSHTGTLNLKNGKFYFEDGKLKGGDFVIDMRTINVTDLSGGESEKLITDLKGNTFFEVKKYPTATFHLTRIEPSKNTEYNSVVYGNLTLKGVRKTISFPANVSVNGTSVSLESAKFTLDRQVFNVFYRPSFKDYVIKDEMDVQLRLATK